MSDGWQSGAETVGSMSLFPVKNRNGVTGDSDGQIGTKRKKHGTPGLNGTEVKADRPAPLTAPSRYRDR